MDDSVALRQVSTTLKLYLVAALLGGCSIVPGSGPQSAAVEQGAATVVLPAPEGASTVGYAFVNLNAGIARSLGRIVEGRFEGVFTDRTGPGALRVGPGDVLAITIFEAGPGGLFTPPATSGVRPGNFVELPAQTIGRDGMISVPYAGSLQAAGLSPGQLERAIEARLKNRALEPQVVVTFREQRSSQVSVLGEVLAPAKVTINPMGERVLDLLARAGGPRYPSYETVVTLQRGSRKATVSLTTLVNAPSNNIYVQAGDTLYVRREQRSFTAMGATGQNGLYFFDSENVSLAYAMGKASGLLDERAEPGAVFVYRLESRRRLESMGIDVAQFHGEIVPTVYALNLRDPSSLFLTQSIQMQDRDVIFVGNAITVDITKFLQFLRIGIATVNEGAGVRAPFVRE